ncbi:hypothetical protein [Umezawaea sp. Da 62-37]|uniref:hypothetical protein n=1 Tax=Umezawaea sp. Da 62-37 TaxID=3075927 RepID=UPI0028F72559|nr:hypothetical protein [Umezawaea sp. Da 62-37]WNV88647.1 hypothetical protein RM788_10215 [Umezawaea sp. Da 62-37]
MRPKRQIAGLLLGAAALCLAVTACGTSSTSGTPTGATGSTGSTGSAEKAGTDAPAASAGSDVPDTGCPISVADLSSATGLTFELGDVRQDHELETQPGVKALVCVFISPSTPQEAGDPLVLRVDTVTGADAAAVRANFERSCTDNGGTLGESEVATGKTCTRGTNTIEGDLSSGDRTVDVYFVNATNDTGAAMTEKLDKVLAAVS